MIKKILFSLVILFVAASVAIFVFGSKLLNAGIKHGVETFGPKITQTAVTLDAVELSLLSGQGSLQGLFVGNPAGFNSDHIIELGQVDVEVDIESLLSEKIIIKQIIIREPAISYEKTLSGSNIKSLMANIEAFTGPASEQSQPVDTAIEPSSVSPAPQVVIQHLLIEDGSIYVGLLGIGQKVALPRIEMHDIGDGDTAMSPAEIANLVLAKIVASIGTAIPTIPAVGDLLNTDGTTIKKAANQTINAVTENLSNVSEGAGEAFNKATDSIKNIFGK